MIKTINLNGSEMKITELGGDNTEIFNNGNDTIYASKLPKVTAGGDEVIAIPAGAIDGLYGTQGTIYLLGTGSVELRGVDHRITKTRGQAMAAGSSISEIYVDEKCNEMLDVAKTYADVKNSEVLVSVKEYADSLNAELAGYIGYSDNDIYGLEADFENCIFTRLAGAVGKTAGADFDRVNAYGGRRRCNLSDSGEVLAYYGDDNFKADGSNGQVMVEQPKFYYRVVPLKTEKIDGADGYHLHKARYYISDTPKAGFKIHPAFVRNGIEVEKIYLSAFESCIYNTVSNMFLSEDEQIADFNVDKLSSIAGAKPCSGTTQKLIRANARKLAHNRGEGWELSAIQSVSATQLLFIIEYATFNSQSTIGNGVTSKTNMAEKTGTTLPLGNISGIKSNSNDVQFISYRGEENLWGNVCCWMDGVIISNPENFNDGQCGKLYISNTGFTDNLNDNLYKFTGICIRYDTGFISAFGYSKEYDWVFIPTKAKGNSALPVGDSYWNGNSGDRPVVYGGAWNDGLNAGVFNLSFYRGFSGYTKETGARLQYIPTH